MRKTFGTIFIVIGIVMYVIFGLLGFVICLEIINQAAGFWGVVICFFLAPVTLLAAPWYALVAFGNWIPLLICYGGGIAASIAFGIGSTIRGDN